jgi:predicted HTH transcriptional regulator
MDNPVCEILFGKLRTKVYSFKQGQKALKAIFDLANISAEETSTKKGKQVTGQRKAEQEKRRKKVGEFLDHGLKAAEIARRLKVTPVTISRDVEAIQGSSKKTKEGKKKEGKSPKEGEGKLSEI